MIARARHTKFRACVGAGLDGDIVRVAVADCPLQRMSHGDIVRFVGARSQQEGSAGRR